MEIQTEQLIAYLTVSAAGATYMARVVYQLIRDRVAGGHATGGLNGDGTSAKVANAVIAVLERHVEREERVLTRLVDLQGSETVMLTRIEAQIARLVEVNEHLHRNMEKQLEALSERIEMLARRITPIP